MGAPLDDDDDGHHSMHAQRHIVFLIPFVCLTEQCWYYVEMNAYYRHTFDFLVWESFYFLNLPPPLQNSKRGRIIHGGGKSLRFLTEIAVYLRYSTR